MYNSKAFTRSTSYTLRLKVGSILESRPGLSFSTWNSLTGQKCVWLYNPITVGRGAIFNYACGELIVSCTCIFNYCKKKFEYDVGVDFIQIKVLIQPKKN